MEEGKLLWLMIGKDKVYFALNFHNSLICGKWIMRPEYDELFFKAISHTADVNLPTEVSSMVSEWVTRDYEVEIQRLVNIFHRLMYI